MSSTEASRQLTLEPADNARLANLCGQFDEHLKQIESRLGVEIANRGNRFRIVGDPDAADSGANVLEALYRHTETETLDPARVHMVLQESAMEGRDGNSIDVDAGDTGIIRTPRKIIRSRGPNQRRYVACMETHDLSFGIGPAGTGKTYLAVAAAINALEEDRVRRIVLVRPAVEAGERLGFLPGGHVAEGRSVSQTDVRRTLRDARFRFCAADD